MDQPIRIERECIYIYIIHIYIYIYMLSTRSLPSAYFLDFFFFFCIHSVIILQPEEGSS